LSRPRFRLSVRDLIELFCRRGGLSKGFSGNHRAITGIRLHQYIQKSRPEHYKHEVPVSYLVEQENLKFEIFGRIDGVFYLDDSIILEEIKSTEKDPVIHSLYPDAMHLVQMKCYAFMLARSCEISNVSCQLTYINIHTRESDSKIHNFDLEDLQIFFDELIEEYTELLQNQSRWKILRNASIENLDFPYGPFRIGQRDLSVEVFRTIRDNKILFAKAPTGTGKTIATLYPTIKALGLSHTDKIFYLTSKTIGRTVAEKALEDMREKGLRLKSVTLTAKQKICFVSNDYCDVDDCQYAEKYYSKLKHAMKEVILTDCFDRECIETIAERYKICPFELSLDISLVADVIICDLNYAFDPLVYLKRYFELNTENYTFLIDEAHNLPERLRSMYSASFSKNAVLEFKRLVKDNIPVLKKKAAQVNRILLDLKKQITSEGKTHQVCDSLPEELFQSVRTLTYSIELWLEKNKKSELRKEISDFYFICSIFMKISEMFDSHYRFYLEIQGRQEVIAKLFCIDPSSIFSKLISRSHATVFFSATLFPMDYFQSILLNTDIPSRVLMLPSPFPEANFQLVFQNRIGTRYKVRDRFYGDIAQVIVQTVNSRKGNYLIFFPSYVYMEKVMELLGPDDLKSEIIQQKPDMTEAEREAFLDYFEQSENVTAFAVMGGIFGEGIDLAGDKLIGVIVVGVGIPQVCLERDLIRSYYEELNGLGFLYAYQFPGFIRVMQATGRLIRTETDRGVAVLIDERFSQSSYRNMYPQEWKHYKNIGDHETLKALLFTFWKNTKLEE